MKTKLLLIVLFVAFFLSGCQDPNWEENSKIYISPEGHLTARIGIAGRKTYVDWTTNNQDIGLANYCLVEENLFVRSPSGEIHFLTSLDEDGKARMTIVCYWGDRYKETVNLCYPEESGEIP